MLLTLIGFFVVYSLTVVLTGNASYLIPGVILFAIFVGGGFLYRGLTKAQLNRHDGDVEAARSDNEDPIPSTGLIPDDSRPAGDSPELHDEINPHDIPKWDTATRAAAEEMAGGEGGTTRGHEEGGAGGASTGQASDDTAERAGREESAPEAKQAGPGSR